MFQGCTSLDHATNCSGHNIYLFGIILYFLVQSPIDLTLLVYYPNKAKTIDITFWRTTANFLNVDPQPIIVIKTFNESIFPFAKGLHWNSFLWNNGNIFLMEGNMGLILALTRRFISNNTKMLQEILEQKQ